jgi:glutathione synthase
VFDCYLLRSSRIPAKGNFKGNLAAGAVGVGQPLSQRDYWLCKQIAPTLKAKYCQYFFY